MKRRTRTLFTVATALLALQTSSVFAQASYPVKPIRMIVPVAPGGGADITTRTIAQKMRSEERRVGKEC